MGTFYSTNLDQSSFIAQRVKVQLAHMCTLITMSALPWISQIRFDKDKLQKWWRTHSQLYFSFSHNMSCNIFSIIIESHCWEMAIYENWFHRCPVWPVQYTICGPCRLGCLSLLLDRITHMSTVHICHPSRSLRDGLPDVWSLTLARLIGGHDTPRI